MSADAMARLRAVVARHDEHAGPRDEPDGHVDDLRAVLDRAALLDEALDALEGLFADRIDGAAVLRADSDDADVRHAAAVLAKAGRR